ncbi:MAG: GTPase Era [Candidatus Binatia bacterium]|nr:MAG: GTPase Era [Candidatus Binatia bacterium]
MPVAFRLDARLLPKFGVVETSENHKSGFVALVGRPNVGKSTLLNRLLGQKIAIVTPKPQTTRGRIRGILTLPEAQIVFVDTPGLHEAKTLINRRMVQAAEEAVEEADLVLWLVDATQGVTAEDRAIATRLQRLGPRLTVVLNKIDRLKANDLIPILAELGRLLPDTDVVPVSATEGANLDELLRVVIHKLPPGPRLYDPETLTDQTERAIVQEIIREQVLLQTRQEVPYAVAVTVESFQDKGSAVVIQATIHVERETQKPILIGKGGSRIKHIGQAAREQIEQLLGKKVYLELFVRVQEDWTKDPARLREFGL